MVNKTDMILEKLKEVRLELFRNAANLDTAIRNIEINLDEHNREYLKMLVRCEQCERESYNIVTDYDKLIRKEQEIWEQLINSIK